MLRFAVTRLAIAFSAFAVLARTLAIPPVPTPQSGLDGHGHGGASWRRANSVTTHIDLPDCKTPTDTAFEHDNDSNSNSNRNNRDSANTSPSSSPTTPSNTSGQPSSSPSTTGPPRTATGTGTPIVEDTTETESPNMTKEEKTTILGIVIGGVTGLGAFIVAILAWRNPQAATAKAHAENAVHQYSQCHGHETTTVREIVCVRHRHSESMTLI